jgi:hypothetical protein
VTVTLCGCVHLLAVTFESYDTNGNGVLDKVRLRLWHVTHWHRMVDKARRR